MLAQLSHQEISLLLYALEGAESTPVASSAAEASCEEACPIVDHLDEMFGGLTPEKKLINHLNNHLRDALFECGMHEVIGKIQDGNPQTVSPEEWLKIQQVNQRLQTWSCEIKFDEAEKALLNKAFSRLPSAAWVSMPRTLWRLRKKIRSAS
jgi:hypothetical protein